MIVAVNVQVGVEVDSEDQAEEACATLDMNLESRLDGFPHGVIVGVAVDGYQGPLSDTEVDERGWSE